MVIIKSTIKDVAKKSNVSVATVSRILNDLGGYSDETKQRVLKAIEELDYQRNAVARGLVMKNTNTVAVLLPYVSTIFHSQILSGIEDIAQQNGYSIIICNVGKHGSRMIDQIKLLAQRQVDGIILTSINMTDEQYELIESLKIPYILVSMISYKHQIPYVRVDDMQASYSATKYLIQNGHKKIAMISGPLNDPIAGQQRIYGYKCALRDYGLPINEKLIKYGFFGYEHGVKCMEELLDENEEFSAVFAASDDMAVGALQAAYKRGIHVPKELSVMGYDNTRVAEMAIPPLTVVGQPLYEMGNIAMDKLINMINKDEYIQNIVLSHEIVERESVLKINI